MTLKCQSPFLSTGASGRGELRPSTAGSQTSSLSRRAGPPKAAEGPAPADCPQHHRLPRVSRGSENRHGAAGNGRTPSLADGSGSPGGRHQRRGLPRGLSPRRYRGFRKRGRLFLARPERPLRPGDDGVLRVRARPDLRVQEVFLERLRGSQHGTGVRRRAAVQAEHGGTDQAESPRQPREADGLPAHALPLLRHGASQGIDLSIKVSIYPSRTL